MLNLPLDAAVQLARQKLLFGKPTVVLKPDIPCTVTQRLLLLQDLLQKSKVRFGCRGRLYDIKRLSMQHNIGNQKKEVIQGNTTDGRSFSKGEQSNVYFQKLKDLSKKYPQRKV